MSPTMPCIFFLMFFLLVWLFGYAPFVAVSGLRLINIGVVRLWRKLALAKNYNKPEREAIPRVSLFTF